MTDGNDGPATPRDRPPPPPPREPAAQDASEPADESAPRRKRRWPKVLGIVGLVMIVLAGGVAAGGIYLLNRLSGNVKTVQVQTAQAPASHEAVNILLMGSDARTGKGNKGYGLDAGRGGQRSDTTILLHIAADRESATAVSIPRDTWVAQPACATNGQVGVFNKFNNAFDAGGPSCTTDLVQQMTGVPVHHIAVVDFGGFKNVIDALGGVEVCLNQAIYDQDSQLDLPAGTTLVDGERALAFVRARKTLGDGSDIGRIKRQQVFLSSAIRKATDTGLLLNPVKLFKVLDTATQSLTVDDSLNDLGEMRTLIESVRSIDPTDITFVTMPFEWRDDANVKVDQDKADEIWTALKNDTPWPPPVSRAPDGKRLTVPPSQINVQVVNASGTPGMAEKASLQLRSIGFNAQPSDQSSKKRQTSAIRYPAGLAKSARTVSYATDADMTESAKVYSTTLYVGKDWSTVKSQITVAKPKTGSADPRTEPTQADESICAG